jgi:hypothetical protein
VALVTEQSTGCCGALLLCQLSHEHANRPLPDVVAASRCSLQVCTAGLTCPAHSECRTCCTACTACQSQVPNT